MRYFTWKQELASSILWVIVGCEFHKNCFDLWLTQVRNQTFFESRGGFVKLGLFDKHFLKTQDKKVPERKNLKFFLLDTFKGPPSDLRQFLTIESPLKMIKNAFYFMIKALFVLEIFTFLSWLFNYVGNRLDKKAMVNYKTYDVTAGQK